MSSSLYAYRHTEASALLPEPQYRASTTARLQVPLFVSRARAAQMLAVSVQTIDKLVKQGKLPVIHEGRSVHIKLSSLDAYTQEVSIK